MIQLDLNPSNRDLRRFGILMGLFAGLLGGLVIWKGDGLLGAAVYLGSAWLISLVFNIREIRSQLWGPILPALCATIGGSVRAGAEPLSVATAVWVAGGLLAAATMAWPGIGRVVYVGLMRAAAPIGWTVSHLVLAVAYYLVLVPVGLIMRVAGRDPMQRRFDRPGTTYWVEHDPAGDVARYFRQF